MLSILSSNICLGVLPPEYYIAMERKAKIRAVAIVKNVESGAYDEKTGAEKQTVTFETVSPLVEGNIPKNFTAYCSSRVKQSGFVGGEIYYNPKKMLGKKVYVAVSENKGKIVVLRLLDAKEIAKLEEQFKNRNLLLGQIDIKDRVNILHNSFDNFYSLRINGKAQGSFEHKKNKSYPQAYLSELQIKGDKSSEKYSIRSYYSGGAQFQLDEIHLEKNNTDTCMITFEYNSREKPYEGLLKKSGKYPAAKNTVSDFALFNIVTLLPFDKDATLNFTLLDSLGLILRKDMKLKFAGEDNGLYKFVQSDSKGNCTAQYWLNKNHVLQRVAWGGDKLFVKVDKGNP